MGWLSLTLSLLQAAPAIIAGIKTLETAIVGVKKGASRKEVLMHAFSAAPPIFAAAASAFIDSTVGTMKASGALAQTTQIVGGALDGLGAGLAVVVPVAVPV
jgi:hypothetical protein